MNFIQNAWEARGNFDLNDFQPYNRNYEIY